LVTRNTGDSPLSARLVAPDLCCRESFVEALDEYHQEGLHTELRPSRLTSVAGFSQWIDDLREAGIEGRSPIERDRVPHRIMWWVAGDQYLGRVRINLRLNDELVAFGGHIGYDIRPSARGRGHATALLGAALRIASGSGIDRALLTCAPDNHASRRVIEHNGGVLDGLTSAGRLRYWCHAG
jgi:predicted acetyltransferase